MRAEAILQLAHGTMAVCTALSAVAIYLAYGLEAALPLPAVVLSHLALIVLPGGIKIGYVLRLTALKQLGRAVD